MTRPENVRFAAYTTGISVSIKLRLTAKSMKRERSSDMQNHFQKYRLEVVREETFDRDYTISPKNSADIFKYLVDVCRLHKNPSEVFIVIAINAKGQTIGFTTAAVGDLCSAPTHPREIFKFAVCSNAGSIVCAHNHPSEDPTPSEADIFTAKRLAEVGELLGIPVLDHIIVGNESSYVSMKAKGLF